MSTPEGRDAAQRWLDELARSRAEVYKFVGEVAPEVDRLRGILAQVDRDLSALQVDLANGVSVEVAGRELVRTLQMIRKVTGDQGRGSDDG